MAGFFDPLGFYKDKTVRQKKKLREGEWGNGQASGGRLPGPLAPAAGADVLVLSACM